MTKKNKIASTIIFNKKIYPRLFDLSEDKINNYIERFINLGYNTYFPDLSEASSKDESINRITSQLDELKNQINNPEMLETVNNLKDQVDSLLGLNKFSNKKGEVSETVIENIIKSRYGDLEYQVTRSTPHMGDGIITLPSNKNILTEVKNYTNKVDNHEVEKLKRDMIENNMKWGLFISFNSSIINCRDLDIKTFQNNGDTFTIIFLGNLGQDITRLDLAINLLRLIINKLNNLESFPWITQELNLVMEQFNVLSDKSNTLLESYRSMEDSINIAKDKHFQNLYNYRLEIKEQVKKINSQLDSTLKESLLKDQSVKVKDFLLDKTKDKKLKILIDNFVSIFDNSSIYLIEMDDKFFLKKDDILISEIKLMKKKIVINWLTLNITCYLEINKSKSNQQVLDTCKLISNI